MPVTSTEPVDKQVKLLIADPFTEEPLHWQQPVDSRILLPLRADMSVIYFYLFTRRFLFSQVRIILNRGWLMAYSHTAFTVWNFKLKRDVRFHNGRELTSYDVRYTVGNLKIRTAPFMKPVLLIILRSLI